MPREQYGRQQQGVETPATEEVAGDPAIASSTAFTSAGTLPPVETGEGAPAPTASERAYGPTRSQIAAALLAATVATGGLPADASAVEASAVAPQTASERAYGPGPGVRVLEAMLAVGTPKPEAVVELIDKHRDERDAMFALVGERLGNDYARSVHAAMDRLRASVSRRELVAGDPADPNGGYFVVSQAERGARWRTRDGDFTGTAGREGLQARYRIDEDDALQARVGRDRSATLAWMRDGRNQGELFHERRGDGHDTGIRRRFDIGGDQLTAGLRHRVDGLGATDGAYATYQRGTTTAEAAVGVRDGQLAESLSLARNFGGGYSGSAQLQHGAEGTTGSIAGQYADATTRVDGNLTRGPAHTSAHLGATEQISPHLTLSGAVDHVRPDQGASQTTVSLSERYREGNVIQGLDVTAGTGARDYVQSSGSVDAQLGPRLYGGVFGSTEVESGRPTSGHLGASLTFTSSEKSALTLAGLIDQDGNLETRLQFDIFKQRIESISDLDRNKQRALISLFLSYKDGTEQRRLDSRFGSPQLEAGDGRQITGGIRIRF